METKFVIQIYGGWNELERDRDVNIVWYGRGPRGSTLPWNAVRKCAVRRERSDGGLKNSLKNELTLTWEWEGKKKVRERNRRTRFYSFANELSLLFFCLPSFGVVAFPRWYVCANLASLDSIRPLCLEKKRNYRSFRMWINISRRFTPSLWRVISRCDAKKKNIRSQQHADKWTRWFHGPENS